MQKFILVVIPRIQLWALKYKTAIGRKFARLKELEGFIVTMDIEKAFYSLDHNFLISALEKYGKILSYG